jgi:signal transduction histidine kinase
MSIRLRLTLLYTSILALTIVTFSLVLYALQSQATLETTKAALLRQSRDYANLLRRPPMRHEMSPMSTAPTILPGRWTQVRSLDGNVIRRTPDLTDTTLPLSEAGWRAVNNNLPWFETAVVEGEPLLIYSQLIATSERTSEIVQIAAPISERENALGTLRMLLIAGDTLIILAAFAIGWTLAGAALEPIHRITQTAQAIGAARDFRQRIAHRGPNDEIGQLATMLNTMLGELESAYRHVQQALEMQKRFVADASHELRTPLTTIRGNIELLRHDVPMESAERAEVLADTKAEVERLIRLVNQLLWLARADAHRPLHRERVALEPLIEEVCRQTQLLAPQRTIHIDHVSDAFVWAERDALKQVLLILLDNARMHTPTHATIRVTTTLDEQAVAITIQDTGPGIPPDVLPHVFERFYRGDPARHTGGTGLGLAIAKELIEAQGGTITVQSTVGQGSAFTIKLERAFPAAHP